MTATTKLALELLQNNAANQALANTTFAQLNQLVQASVADRINTPPDSPANEALYIITATATGVWAGKENQLAYWLTSTNAWQFIAPREGMLVHVNDEDLYYKYTGSAWMIFSTGGGGSGTAIGFLAKPNTGVQQSIPAGVFTKVLFQVESFDTNALYDSANSRFQPTIAGLYVVMATTGINHTAGTDTGKRFIATITLNGSTTLASGSIGVNNQASSVMTTVAAVYMNGTTDYVEILVRQDMGANKDFNLDASALSAVYMGA